MEYYQCGLFILQSVMEYHELLFCVTPTEVFYLSFKLIKTMGGTTVLKAAASNYVHTKSCHSKISLLSFISDTERWSLLKAKNR